MAKHDPKHHTLSSSAAIIGAWKPNYAGLGLGLGALKPNYTAALMMGSVWRIIRCSKSLLQSIYLRLTLMWTHTPMDSHSCGLTLPWTPTPVEDKSNATKKCTQANF